MNKQRWSWLMESMGLTASFDCYDSLVTAYSEKHRYYHTSKHINAMLNHFDKVKHVSKKPDELELAIWFHDAIYQPFSKTNELDSANWAKNFLTTSGIDPQISELVHSLVMATDHSSDVTTNDEKLIVDIDLTILGAEANVYDQFEHNVRKEYKLVPSFVFNKKRKEILVSFLQQDSIYRHDYFKDKFEATARENLERTISRL